MSTDWRNVLHQYMKFHNQMEVEYSLRPFVPFVTDSKFIQREERRLNRLQDWHNDRKVTALGIRSKARIVRTRQFENKIVAEMRIHRRWRYILHELPHEEERIFFERITLAQSRAQWSIVKVEVSVPERAVPPMTEQLENGGGMAPPPYLNESALAASASRNVPYNREKARQYAETYWQDPNPAYIYFEVDCTNYVSQCLFAGGAPMNYTGKRNTGWWYQGRKHGRESWSYSWTVSQSLQAYLNASRSRGLRAERENSAAQLTIGDVILYDWDGDGRYQHSTIVTAIDASGMPLVNAHTVNSRMRYWDYRDSYAWSEKTRYRFFHIADSF